MYQVYAYFEYHMYRCIALVDWLIRHPAVLFERVVFSERLLGPGVTLSQLHATFWGQNT